MKKISIHAIIIMTIGMLFSSCSGEKAQKAAGSGLLTTATVLDGIEKQKGSKHTYTVTLQYETIDGKAYKVDELVTNKEWFKVYKDLNIPVVYEKGNPTNVDAIILDEDIKKYFGIENKSLTPFDLATVINLQQPDSLEQYLNKQPRPKDVVLIKALEGRRMP